ncbi:hypothetical protein ACWIFB_07000 [Dietzia sp. NPDC055340]
MIDAIFNFFNQLLGTGSAVAEFGSVTAGNVADIVTGSIGLPDVGPVAPEA